MKGIFSAIAKLIREPTEVQSPEPMKVQVVDPEVEYVSLLDAQLPCHGEISVRYNKVKVSNPENGGSFATLVIPESDAFEVTIDGERSVGQQVVTADQDIEIHFNHKFRTNGISLFESEDKLSVILNFVLNASSTYRLRDAEPASQVVLAVEMVELRKAPSMEDLVSKLEQSPYQGFIVHEALGRICCSTESCKEVVLTGRAPTPPTPTRYEMIDLPKQFDVMHRRMRVEHVSPGTPIATIIPGRDGKPGIDVFGELVPPPTRKSAEPSLGTGVKIIQDKVVATLHGSVVFTDDRIDVVPELVISHDLTPKHGNIVFRGNVVVNGTVHDGCFIRAHGSIRVDGHVYGAKLISDDDIAISGGVIKSTILAGQSKMVHPKLLALVRSILVDVHRFQMDYDVLMENMQKRVDAQAKIPLIASVLLEKRHQRFDEALQSLCELPRDEDMDGDDSYRQLIGYIQTKWQGISRTNIVQDDIDHLVKSLKDYQRHLENLTSLRTANVRAASFTSCVVRATKNITVFGQGVFQSVLESGAAILVSGATRGGFLVAENVIRVDELGTVHGIETSAKVIKRGGRITIRTRHPNTVLEVNGVRSRNDEVQERVTYRG